MSWPILHYQAGFGPMPGFRSWGRKVPKTWDEELAYRLRVGEWGSMSAGTYCSSQRVIF